ncbi:MAG TPA: phosphoribosyltransferase [Patescibacteria group bacterium]|jgi:hypothetical protein|nr:phosphoribosyltransferase [Patescibacteria group bacterium]
MSELPYVISGELELDGTVDPVKIDRFRESLDSDLREMGQNTVWLSAEAIRSGLRGLVANTKLPIVSLDQRYISASEADYCLGISRAANPDMSDAGYDSRLGFPPLSKQLDVLGKRYGGREVLLVDDVLFSGSMVDYLESKLKSRGVKIAALACGVAIGEGRDKLAARGIVTESVNDFEEVEDELCERDFTTQEGSGRKVKDNEESFLYIDDRFSRLEWSSTPVDFASDFCLRSLERNLQLLRPEMPFPNFVGYKRGLMGEVLANAIAERSQ